MREEKEFLKKKMIEFQLNIAEMNRSLHEQKYTFETKEKKLFIELFEILDAFDNLEKTIRAKEETLDKTALRLVKSFRTINRKLLRLLKANHIAPIDLSDNTARMDLCKIIGTEVNHELENEHILQIEKSGYIDTQQNIVLRKAEVITVSNK